MQPDPAVAAEYRAAGSWGDTTVGDAETGWSATLTIVQHRIEAERV